ncbi:MAG: hypothetical protein FWH17_08905 [Oscillospiraceae bacterium]|nr:hypothetical protein [Oscillospiraceae bacterium]
MDKSGIGIGSTSLVLILAVLCLALFAFISYSSAENDMALANAEAELILGYYKADALAISIAESISRAENIPDSLFGVKINLSRDESTRSHVAEFACAVSDRKELFAKIAIIGDDYKVLVWRMQDTDGWNPDMTLPIWPGG